MLTVDEVVVCSFRLFPARFSRSLPPFALKTASLKEFLNSATMSALFVLIVLATKSKSAFTSSVALFRDVNFVNFLTEHSVTELDAFLTAPQDFV